MSGALYSLHRRKRNHKRTFPVTGQQWITYAFARRSLPLRSLPTRTLIGLTAMHYLIHVGVG